jgi:methyl-accepting chemotaxis protein
MGIHAKILMGFSTVLALTGAVSFSGWRGLTTFSERVETNGAATAVREATLNTNTAAARIRYYPAAKSEALTYLAAAETALNDLTRLRGDDSNDQIRIVREALRSLATSINSLAGSQTRIQESQSEVDRRIQDLVDQAVTLGSEASNRYDENLRAFEAKRNQQSSAASVASAAQRLLLALSEMRAHEDNFAETGSDEHLGKVTDFAIKASDAASAVLRSDSDLIKRSEAEPIERATAALLGSSSELSDAHQTLSMARAEVEGGRISLAQKSNEVDTDLLVFANSLAPSEGTRIKTFAKMLQDRLPELMRGKESSADMFKMVTGIILETLSETPQEVSAEAERIAAKIRDITNRAERQVRLENTAIDLAHHPEEVARRRIEKSTQISESTQNLVDMLTRAMPGINAAAVTARHEFEYGSGIKDSAAKLSSIALEIQSESRNYALNGSHTDATHVLMLLNRARSALSALGGVAAGEDKRRHESMVGTIPDVASAFQRSVAATAERATSQTALNEAMASASKSLSELMQAQRQELSDGRDTSEALVIYGSFVALLLGLLAAFTISRSLVKPITGLTASMMKLADGDLDSEIYGDKRKDEFGAAAKAVMVFRENARAVARLETEAVATREQAERDRRESQLAMAAEVERSLGEIAASLSSAATELTASGEALGETAEIASSEASAANMGATKAGESVRSVASAAEQMSGSVREIAKQIAEAADIAKQAVSEAEATNTTVQNLADGAARIGEVVKLISGIASQTNLLALNATIEAARAGEAGKGFAVVASEVKSLAGQTAKATEEISSQISLMREAVGSAVEAIKGIGSTISRMDEAATTIATAIEEQDIVTRHIASGAGEAAVGVDAATRSVAKLAEGAQDNSQAVNHLKESAESVAGQAVTLQTQVTELAARLRQ